MGTGEVLFRQSVRSNLYCRTDIFGGITDKTEPALVHSNNPVIANIFSVLQQ